MGESTAKYKPFFSFAILPAQVPDSQHTGIGLPSITDSHLAFFIVLRKYAIYLQTSKTTVLFQRLTLPGCKGKKALSKTGQI